MRNLSIAVAAVAAVAVASVVVSDLSHKRKIAETVDRVYLNIGEHPDGSALSLLETAEHDVGANIKAIKLLPKSACENARSKIHSQLFSVQTARDEITVLGTDETGKRLSEDTRSRYAEKVPEFKSKLSYIRRSL
jgi:hypothetical protein